MDSKEKAGLRLPQVTVPGAARDELRTARVNRWLFGAVIVLVAGVIALGAALIVQTRPEQPAPAPAKAGLADAATVKIIDAVNEAGSGELFASFFTVDGVMDEVNIGKVTTGRAAIARHQQRYVNQGLWAQPIGPVIQSGDYVAQAMLYNGNSLILVYELTPDGKISHWWGIAN